MSKSADRRARRDTKVTPPAPEDTAPRASCAAVVPPPTMMTRFPSAALRSTEEECPPGWATAMVSPPVGCTGASEPCRRRRLHVSSSVAMMSSGGEKQQKSEDAREENEGEGDGKGDSDSRLGRRTKEGTKGRGRGTKTQKGRMQGDTKEKGARMAVPASPYPRTVLQVIPLIHSDAAGSLCFPSCLRAHLPAMPHVWRSPSGDDRLLGGASKHNRPREHHPPGCHRDSAPAAAKPHPRGLFRTEALHRYRCVLGDNWRTARGYSITLCAGFPTRYRRYW